ncbi:hypothetical protein ACFQ3Z_38155 [Streptomyces nogalater]
MATHESELRALLANRAEAQQTKDIDRLMSFYAADAVYYDVVPHCGSPGPTRSAATSCAGSTGTSAPSAWTRTTSPS